jgi:ribonuclease HII
VIVGFALERATGRPVAEVAGVDEVGRGPLAGPVLAAAVMLDPRRVPPTLLAGLDDSKRLSPARRAALDAALRAGPGVVWALGAASVADIAHCNILGASQLAMRRAVARLASPPTHLLIDGDRTPSGLPAPATAVVGGDGRAASIAAASILAKVARDRLMARLDRRWPGYGWAANAGYPTAAHRQALAVLGVTPHHRLGFAGVHALSHRPDAG